jgi:hypothetical protein
VGYAVVPILQRPSLKPPAPVPSKVKAKAVRVKAEPAPELMATRTRLGRRTPPKLASPRRPAVAIQALEFQATGDALAEIVAGAAVTELDTRPELLEHAPAIAEMIVLTAAATAVSSLPTSTAAATAVSSLPTSTAAATAVPAIPTSTAAATAVPAISTSTAAATAVPSIPISKAGSSSKTEAPTTISVVLPVVSTLQDVMVLQCEGAGQAKGAKMQRLPILPKTEDELVAERAFRIKYEAQRGGIFPVEESPSSGGEISTHNKPNSGFWSG